MQVAIALTREKELRLLEQAVIRAENEGLQVLLRDPESRVLSCALCGAIATCIPSSSPTELPGYL